MHLVDDVSQKVVRLELTHHSKRIEGDRVIDTEMEPAIRISLSYSEYRLFYELIRSSLFELSGWKFTMELQRSQFIEKIKMGQADQDLDNLAVSRSSKSQASFRDNPKDFF